MDVWRFNLLKLINDIESRFNIDDIKKLSARQPKSFPNFIEMHDSLLKLNEDELKIIEIKIKATRSKSKPKFIKAFKAFNTIKSGLTRRYYREKNK